MRQIEYLTFNKNNNPELLKKLNAVAPYEYRNVHQLAQFIMHEWLDKRIGELGIDINQQSQPACG